ncbi:hypothetical protein GGC65_001778 [Sphingopyxis sp. OAS728]|nr:hypothetical protein [Sphingopyxis sp. OAS728]
MNFMTGLLISLTLLTVWSGSTSGGLGRIGFENLNATRPKPVCGEPEMGQPPGCYILSSAAFEILFHMLLAELAKLPTETTAPKKIRARISPYSTAVAALVDRISL